jgi:ribonuclease VapC
MVIDSSAIIACLLDEPEQARFIAALDTAPTRLLSMVTYVETAFVILGRKGDVGLSDFLRFIDRAAIESVVVNEHQGRMAIEAFQRYGKGRHPAGLNLGDCFAYALAKASGEPLLFKGGDFALTDLVPALDR